MAEHGDGIVVGSPAGDETTAIDENKFENVAESNPLREVDAETDKEDLQLLVVSEKVGFGTNGEAILNENIHKCSDDKNVVLDVRVDGETNENITIYIDNLNTETNTALSDHISSDTSANGVGVETTLPVEPDESISCDRATSAELASETLHQAEDDDHDRETALDLSTSRTTDNNEGK